MAKMDATKIITGAISIIIGFVLLPVMALFVTHASQQINSTGQYVENTNVTGIPGLTSLLNLVMYGFAFGLVGVGIGMIYIGYKGGKK